MGRVTSRVRTVRVDVAAGARADRPDHLAVEEPLEIRLDGKPLTVTMRTPGHDVELVHGLLHSEGVLRRRSDVVQARYCAGSVVAGESGLPENTFNVLEVDLAAHVARPARELTRSFFTSSACGVCGTASIEDLRVRATHEVAGDDVQVDAALLSRLPDRLRQEQSVFDRTGGIHAAGLFTAAGKPLVVREDVGRHNALDKVVGWALLEDRLPLVGHVIVVSGRASFELVQKAYLAGAPVLAAVSAPSSLAVETAREVGMTLAGFVRGDRLNLYSRPDRVGPPASTG